MCGGGWGGGEIAQWVGACALIAKSLGSCPLSIWSPSHPQEYPLNTDLGSSLRSFLGGDPVVFIKLKIVPEEM